jgi:hypothetical protein
VVAAHLFVAVSFQQYSGIKRERERERERASSFRDRLKSRRNLDLRPFESGGWATINRVPHRGGLPRGISYWLRGGASEKSIRTEVYGRSVRDEIHHPREQCPPIGARRCARTLFRFMEVYPRPSVYGQGGLTLPLSLSPSLFPALVAIAWMSTLARRFARQGRKDDKTTLERVRDTNRGINEGVKEPRERRASPSRDVCQIPSINRDVEQSSSSRRAIVEQRIGNFRRSKTRPLQGLARLARFYRRLPSNSLKDRFLVMNFHFYYATKVHVRDVSFFPNSLTDYERVRASFSSTSIDLICIRNSQGQRTRERERERERTTTRETLRKEKLFSRGTLLSLLRGKVQHSN